MRPIKQIFDKISKLFKKPLVEVQNKSNTKEAKLLDDHLYYQNKQLYAEKCSGGVEFQTEKSGIYMLCGCSLSSNKPFCDTSHYELLKIERKQYPHIFKGTGKQESFCDCYKSKTFPLCDQLGNEQNYFYEKGKIDRIIINEIKNKIQKNS